MNYLYRYGYYLVARFDVSGSDAPTYIRGADGLEYGQRLVVFARGADSQNNGIIQGHGVFSIETDVLPAAAGPWQGLSAYRTPLVGTVTTSGPQATGYTWGSPDYQGPAAAGTRLTRRRTGVGDVFMGTVLVGGGTRPGGVGGMRVIASYEWGSAHTMIAYAQVVAAGVTWTVPPQPGVEGKLWDFPTVAPEPVENPPPIPPGGDDGSLPPGGARSTPGAGFVAFV